MLSKTRSKVRHLERRLPVSGVLAVILSAAKDLCVRRARPFAALRVTLCDCSNGQGQFVQIEPCPKKLIPAKVSNSVSSDYQSSSPGPDQQKRQPNSERWGSWE